MLIPVDSACGPKGFCQLQSRNVGEVKFLWDGHILQWNISTWWLYTVNTQYVVFHFYRPAVSPMGFYENQGWVDVFQCLMTSTPVPWGRVAPTLILEPKIRFSRWFVHAQRRDVLLFPTRATIEPEAAAIWKVWDSPEALKIHVSNLIRTCFEIGNETTRQWEVHLRNPLVIICSVYIYIQTFVLSQHLPHLQHWFEVWRILFNKCWLQQRSSLGRMKRFSEFQRR